MKRLLAVAIMALATAAPAYGCYYDEGGGNRPDCTGANIGDSFGPWHCDHDPTGGATDWRWVG